MKKLYGWTIALVLLGFVLAGIFLTLAPDQIPVHYNIRGEADRWGSKYEFLVMPVCSLLFGALMSGIARYEGKKGRDMNEKVVGILNIWILIVFNILWGFFMWKSVDRENLGSGIGELPGKLISILLSASLIPVGNLMPKAARNGAFGLRTKWSMASDWCWQQSQRIGGYVSVGTGILGVIVSALCPAAWSGYILLVLLAGMTVICCWASYRIYKKQSGEMGHCPQK